LASSSVMIPLFKEASIDLIILYNAPQNLDKNKGGGKGLSL